MTTSGRLEHIGGRTALAIILVLRWADHRFGSCA
jgi:hypothetical protein